tara:strand:- start:2370 stop:4007 length:1638 start_codon:yes stop_codon:yes gene_type:complete
MAYTNREIVDYLLANPDMSDAQIVKAMETFKISPAQMAEAVSLPVGDVISRVAATVPSGSSITLGDTVVSPNYQYIQSGEDNQVGPIETIFTTKTDGDVNYKAPVGSEYQQYGADGTFQRTGTIQKELSFFGGLADAFNDPVVQAVVLGLGAGDALGNALGLTGSTAQAVGTGLFKGGAAAAGGADIEDALKLGLLSGGLVYGGSELAKTLNTAGGAVLGDASDIAIQMADSGKTLAEIETALTNSGFSADVVAESLKDAANTLTPKAINIPSTVSGLTDAVNVVGQSATPTLSNLINTIASTASASTTPALTVTGDKQVDQQTLNAVTSILNGNVATTPTVNVTGNKNLTADQVVNLLATTPITTPTATTPTVNVTGTNTNLTTTVPSVISTIPTTTATTTTTADKTKETDPLKVAQLVLTAAGLLTAGSALTDTGTQFPIVPIPEGWRTPPKTGVAPFTPLTPIDFGSRNLLKGTQWEKFLDPNYGQVPEQRQYTQPSNLSYNDLMSILGSKQSMPAKSSLSINDIISGIQNQYGQAPRSTMG